MKDLSETSRRSQVAKINSNPSNREELEAKHGQVWDTQQIQEDFNVLGFMAPYVRVRRKSDGAEGTLIFQHDPRFYFGFE